MIARFISTCAFAVLLFCHAVVFGDDWPAFRHDVARSAISTESFNFPLERAWTYQSAQPPSPAWPPPHFILLNRLDFDYAPQPVAAGGIVCFGSSSDDTVRALDLETGEVKWAFTTGGPVRVAPQIVDDRVYFGSDDGCAYCVSMETGDLIWKFEAAPNNRKYLGNARMISRWPIRTGVLVETGIAYLAAGMWATEGVFAYALDAETGAEIWCNDTSGYAGVNYNTLLTVENRSSLRHGVHDGDFGYYGLTPQGALAVTDEVLLIPNGYNSTAGMDRKTGELLFGEPKAGRGGTWVRAEKDSFRTIYRHRNKKILLMKCDARTGERLSFHHYNIPNLTTIPPRSQKANLHHEPGQTSILVHKDKVLSRNAYAMIMASNHLVSGHDGYVSASNLESETELWRASVNGKAYGLAVADGRLIVTTDTGEIVCFGGPPQKPRTSAKLSPPSSVPSLPVMERLRETGMNRGYALVLGDESGEISLNLARNLNVQVINALQDQDRVRELRARLVESTSLYGSRVHVPDAAEGVPFADYFANAIVLTDTTKLSGGELFRVLRPCGGVLTFTGSGKTSFERIKQELRQKFTNGEATVDGYSIIRGRLAGALDWDSDDTVDRRVKWPLRPLWFGGPSSDQVTDFKNGNHRPLAAYGRYFVLGEDSLTAVDAYNGAILWTRPIPPRSPDLKEIGGVLQHTEQVWSRELRDAHRRSLRVNDRHVYLQLNEGHFRGEDKGVIVLDARSGRQVEAYAPYKAPPDILLDKPKNWTLQIDKSHSGMLTLEPGEEVLEVRLETVDPAVTDFDEWELFFDFRRPEKRFGLHSGEVVHLRAGPNEEISVPIQARSFGFGAILNSHDGGSEERIQRRYLFCDLTASGLNNGWANVRLSKNDPPAEKPTLIVGEAADLPKVDVVAGWPRFIDPAVAEEPRLHPLTGEPGPRIFRTGTGTCGGFDFSATSVIKRSGAAKVLGIYDFAEDSGLHTFVGVSAGCGPTTLTSQGLLIVSESKARCVCTFPFRTTLTLAPTKRRLNEDWAIFYDRDVDTQVRQAPINLGAPGDRRDADGMLWLGFPRPVSQTEALGYPKLPASTTEAHLPGVWPVARQAGLRVPLKIECDENGGPYRFNGDRTPVAAESRPWLYASGYRGIRRATLKLNLLEPIATAEVAAPIHTNGVMTDDEWPGSPQVHLTETKTDVCIAHDDSYLYIGARRPPPPLTGKSQRRGQIVWTAATEGEDAEIWNDDSCELFLSDQASEHVLRLGGSMSGARFDAVDDDTGWDGDWTHAARAGPDGLVFEMAIPWQTVEKAGLDRKRLRVNFQINRNAQMGEALAYLGPAGRERCRNFALLGIGERPSVSPRSFRLRLHFAEPDDIAPGERVFDVFVQGERVLHNFDIVAASGGSPRQAVTHEFRNVSAAEALELSFKAQSGEPVLNAIELFEERQQP